MENRSPRRDSRDSGHGRNLTEIAHPCQYMRLSPLFPPASLRKGTPATASRAGGGASTYPAAASAPSRQAHGQGAGVDGVTIGQSLW
jgi:hypothetical protein